MISAGEREGIGSRPAVPIEDVIAGLEVKACIDAADLAEGEDD